MISETSIIIVILFSPYNRPQGPNPIPRSLVQNFLLIVCGDDPPSYITQSSSSQNIELLLVIFHVGGCQLRRFS